MTGIRGRGPLVPLALSCLLASCATAPTTPPGRAATVRAALAPAPSVARPATEPVTVPDAASAPAVGTVTLPPVMAGELSPPELAVPVPAATARADEAQARVLLGQLLPSGIKDRNGWRADILSAFTGLKIPYEPRYFCAAIAIIEQESTWQSDPVVPGLDKIVWKEIDQRAGKYHIPLLAVKTALLKSSPDGRSYKARIDALRTEAQMNDLFEDLAADAQKLHLPMGMKNPIRTGGPMQVSVEFAEGHVRVWPYPYTRKGSIRDEVFTRRGGLYFGIANLLHYRVEYPEMIYRFADFNAGRYSSRNAAFQAALVRLSGKKMSLDGDLLNYGSGAISVTQQSLNRLSGRLGLSEAAIERDLKLEKTEGFGQTPLYRRVFELADTKAGRPLPKAVLPQIRLSSPKITRKLTTEWFAKRVDGRYRTCMGRVPAPVAPPPVP